MQKRCFKKKQTDLKNWIETTKDNLTSGDIRNINRLKIEVSALAGFISDLEYVVNTLPERKQPELPILRNNDQRKAFIEAFESWPVWIDIKETEERYYRYDLDNEIYIVVKVYFQKGYSWGELKKEDYWGSNEYYLVKSPESHFKDCQTNMTALIEYLKDYQKRK